MHPYTSVASRHCSNQNKCVAYWLKFDSTIGFYDQDQLVSLRKISKKMSVSEVNRLFEAIQAKYEVDGTVDPRRKALLLEEMMKFEGSENFVQKMDKAFQEIENGVEEYSCDESVDEFPSQVHVLRAKRGRVRKKLFRLFSDPFGTKAKARRSLVEGSEEVEADTSRSLRTRQNKLKFDGAITVFHLFQYSCHAERCAATTITTDNIGSSSTDTVSTSRASTSTIPMVSSLEKTDDASCSNSIANTKF